jgi:hypothetical protein
MAQGVALARQPIEAGILALGALVDVPASKIPVVPQIPDVSDDAAPARGAAERKGTSSPPAGGVTFSKAPRVEIPEISSTERANLRAALPPLYEGDQYAIIELEQLPSSGASDNSSVGGFMPSDADFSVVTPAGLGEDEPGVMDVKLPEEVAAILEQSAKKLNKGLSGSETRK